MKNKLVGWYLEDTCLVSDVVLVVEIDPVAAVAGSAVWNLQLLLHVLSDVYEYLHNFAAEDFGFGDPRRSFHLGLLMKDWAFSDLELELALLYLYLVGL